jgi:hypothetical protein
MWQCRLQEHAHQPAEPERLIEARGRMKDSMGSKYTDAALTVARRMLHECDLIPHLHAGKTHSRSYFLLLELIAEFPVLQQCVDLPNLKSLHLKVGAGGFIDALLKCTPLADWHATSNTEVYEHIRNAKKNNGHSRLLHHSIAQEVGEPRLITVQNAHSEDIELALSILHPQGVLVLQCDNPTDNMVGLCCAAFEHVVVCKPRLIAPSSPDFIIVAHQRHVGTFIEYTAAQEELVRMELEGIQKAMCLATYLTQIDIKNNTDTQKLYFDHVVTNASRIEKAQRVLSAIMA